MKNQQTHSPLLDIVPLIAFFVVNKFYGIYMATAVLLVFSVIMVVYLYLKIKRVPPVLLVSTVLVLVFGLLTIWLNNEDFIKMKVTIINVMFAVFLLAGLAFKKNFIKLFLSSGMQMEEKGWKIVAIAFVGFFLVLAVLNEVIWRNFPTDTWVNFKVFGVLVLSVFFILGLYPVMKKYLISE